MQLSDQELISRCREGDIDAFGLLYARYERMIYRFAYHMLGDPDDADDVKQDTFVKAYRSLPGFRGDCSLTTWLTGIAINVTRDHLRSGRYKFWKQLKATAVDVHEMASFLPSDSVSPERRVLAKERVKELYGVLETLSFNQRTIFLMKFTEELSVDEIGEILGMAVNTVRTHLHRALKAVRSKLGATT